MHKAINIITIKPIKAGWTNYTFPYQEQRRRRSETQPWLDKEENPLLGAQILLRSHSRTSLADPNRITLHEQKNQHAYIQKHKQLVRREIAEQKNLRRNRVLCWHVRELRFMEKLGIFVVGWEHFLEDEYSQDTRQTLVQEIKNQ